MIVILSEAKNLIDNVQDIVRKKNVHNIVQLHISFCLNNYSLD